MYSRTRLPLNLALISLFSVGVILSAPETGLSLNWKMRPIQKGNGAEQKSPQGQSETLLPNGQLLLIGGEGHAGPLPTIFLKDQQSGKITLVPTNLKHARAWHTATLLANGVVLIFGGVGADGHVLDGAELFDPSTGLLTSISVPLLPRAHHTATVLTNGQILFVGGISDNDEVLVSAQLWQFADPEVLQTVSEQTPRRDQSAILEGDGTVWVTGGLNRNGIVGFAEAYDPVTHRFAIANTESDPEVQLEFPTIAASIPQDGSEDVPTSSTIMLRFSRQLNVTTVNPTSITVSGDNGPVPVRVIALERGTLASVAPVSALGQGKTYTVTVSGATDWNGSEVRSTSLSFTTNGPSSATSSDQTEGGNFWNPSQWDQGKSGQGKSPNQSFPPLQGKPGETALAGQVLKLNGEPLEGVTVSIDNVVATTDLTGRFLLAPLNAGHHAMLIDGATANKKARSYGVYEAGVDVVVGKTSVLNYTIWMTSLDTAHAVSIPSPTTQEVVIKTPLLPGLELHIPPHTTITDHNGMPVRKISITPIPIDQPPFPLPRGVLVPTYFTIQPGSAYIRVENSGGPQGAQLYYPNSFHFPSGTVFSFYNYDPDDKGWYVYGQGTVGKDVKQVVPNQGTAIYEFTGAMVSDPSNAPPTGPKIDNPKRGEPVDLQTGLFVYTKTDLALSDTIPLVLTRTYRQGDFISRAFGIGATHPYDVFMVGDNETFPEGYTYQDLILADGGRVHFSRTSPCDSRGFCNFDSATYLSSSTPGDFYGATLRQGGDADIPGSFWILTRKDGTEYTFPDSDAATIPRYAALLSVRDRNGNLVKFDRDDNANLAKITSPNGRWIQFTYDGNNRIILAQDNASRTVHYSYDSNGRLATVTDANGGTWNYTYDQNHQMLSITDSRNILYLTNQYDANGRISKQTNADTGTFQYGYTTDSNGNVTQTVVTDPRGFVERVSFNSDGYETSDTIASGTSDQQTWTFDRQQGSGLVLSVTDPLNRRTDSTYDSSGNVSSLTRLAGTGNAVTTFFAYEPTFNGVTTITDPLRHTQTLSYDSNGNVVAVTDASGHTISFARDSAGRATSIVDPLGNETQFFYDTSGNMVGITDPLGRTASRSFDQAGRLVSFSDPLGNTVTYRYDALDQVTRVTDPSGGQTTLTYDGNENLLTIQDAKGHTIQYSYDNMDRISGRIDSLLSQESYSYDLNGNLSQFADRRGKVTTLNYDGLNRMIFSGYGTQTGPSYESSVVFSYDKGNRITQAVDSASGTITENYDGLDHLMSEVTPQGTVSYTYDSAGRRTSMTPPGQTVINYTFDNSDHLTQIAQGSTIYGIGYDDANRRTSVTLPNGISTNYSYDAASELVDLSYVKGPNFLGNLHYTYDLSGRRMGMSGSYSRVNLPTAISTATYNANNQLTSWGTANLFYDANGNMTSDGTHSYAWDARNRLKQIDSGTTASFAYDTFGRRTSKTLLTAQTGFVYDGTNAIQELNGATITANSIMAGVDVILQRSDSAGVRTFLADGQGSSLGLFDSSGTLQTAYSFDAFGNTTLSGASTTNSFAFTGREFDFGNLYYFRNRYYNPSLQRFISEDPLSAGMSANLYTYADNDPVNFEDPFGLLKVYIWNSTGGSLGGGSWGHVSILLDNGTYISYWPETGDIRNPWKEVTPLTHSPGDDHAAEGKWPDQVIDVNDLNEGAISSWWDDFLKQMKAGRRPYYGQGRNCSTVAAQALQAGGAPTFIDEAHPPYFWSPEDVGRYARAINLWNSFFKH